jgi:histidinol dehydrogenase
MPLVYALGGVSAVAGAVVVGAGSLAECSNFWGATCAFVTTSHVCATFLTASVVVLDALAVVSQLITSNCDAPSFATVAG